MPNIQLLFICNILQPKYFQECYRLINHIYIKKEPRKEGHTKDHWKRLINMHINQSLAQDQTIDITCTPPSTMGDGNGEEADSGGGGAADNGVDAAADSGGQGQARCA